MGSNSNLASAMQAQSPSCTTSGYGAQSSSNSLQQPAQSQARVRAASATLPLGLDLRNNYRPVSSPLDPIQQSPAATPRAVNPQFASTSSPYSTSFLSAPLTAPVDFDSMARAPAIQTTQDYSVPQMSAPIAAPNDFSQAFRSMGSSNGPSSTRTPMRDSFSRGSGGSSSHPGDSTSAAPSSKKEDPYHVGWDMKREQSVTGPPVSTQASIQPSLAAPPTYGTST